MGQNPQVLIKRKEFEYWLESPVTQIFLEEVLEMRNTARNYVNNRVMDVKKLKDLDMEEMAEQRAINLVCNTLLELEIFMSNRIKPEEVARD